MSALPAFIIGGAVVILGSSPGNNRRWTEIAPCKQSSTEDHHSVSKHMTFIRSSCFSVIGAEGRENWITSEMSFLMTVGGDDSFQNRSQECWLWCEEIFCLHVHSQGHIGWLGPSRKTARQWCIHVWLRGLEDNGQWWKTFKKRDYPV